jgi:hypothetical protein
MGTGGEVAMSLHLFSAAADGRWIPVVQALEPLLDGEALHVHRHVREVLDARPCPGDAGPYLVMFSSGEELDELLAGLEEDDRLREHRLVVVLHDSSAASRTKGHALRPRVLFSPPVAPAEIAAVVAKMLASDRRASRAQQR